MAWIATEEALPPDGAIVLTKIDDHHGVRNEQKLRRDGRFWWLPDDTMYVYYTPTHWRNP